MSDVKKLDGRIRLLDATYHELAVEASESDDSSFELAKDSATGLGAGSSFRDSTHKTPSGSHR